MTTPFSGVALGGEENLVVPVQAAAAAGLALAAVLAAALALAVAAPAAAPPAEETAAPAEADAPLPPGKLQLIGWVEHHPGSMVSVALRSVEVRDTGTVYVEVEAVNAFFRGDEGFMSLADPHAWIEDDLGNAHEMVPPTDAERLRFPKDHRLTGVLAFDGPVSSRARTLTVMFNQRPGDRLVSAAQDRSREAPKFLFEQIPLPGVGLEGLADRGAPGSLTDRTAAEVGRAHSPDRLPEVEVTVVRVVSDGRTVGVEFEARNASTRTVNLALLTPVVDDGRGSQFVYVAPDTDERAERTVELAPGTGATGTLSWRGVVAPDAESLTFVLNYGNRGTESQSAPYLRVEGLPIPGR